MFHVLSVLSFGYIDSLVFNSSFCYDYFFTILECIVISYIWIIFRLTIKIYKF